jgi:UPF0716 protein FxsA
MRLVILLFVVGFPLLEIAMLVVVGRRIGVVGTVLLVVVTAIAGWMLLRRQGIGMLTRAAAAARKGEPPEAAAVEGLVGMVAAVLLITPGPIADVLGLILLVPPIRDRVARVLAGRIAQEGGFSVRVYRGRRDGRQPAPGDGEGPSGEEGPVIEGEFERLGEQTMRPPRTNDTR